VNVEVLVHGHADQLAEVGGRIEEGEDLFGFFVEAVG
jgi:hypothetical protein